MHLVGISTESYYDARIHEYQIYSPTLYLTSALDRGGWSTPRSGLFNPRERDAVPIV